MLLSKSAVFAPWTELPRLVFRVVTGTLTSFWVLCARCARTARNRPLREDETLPPDPRHQSCTPNPGQSTPTTGRVVCCCRQSRVAGGKAAGVFKIPNAESEATSNVLETGRIIFDDVRGGDQTPEWSNKGQRAGRAWGRRS